MKSIASSFIIQVILLGTIGCFIFLSFAWAKHGWFWASDTLQVWLFALFIISLFLAFICHPILWLSSKFGITKYAKFVTGFSGLITVILYMGIFTQFEFSFHRYFVFPVNIHSAFIVVGFLFGLLNESMPNKQINKDT
ncbi:hypothetical protein L2737_16505 [Shewanella electrodiphila]|uniref:Lipoprotein n=1 Tax=Shewanella electrodiphila TaxID=934143 RepID=A0ABT0KSR5_9GAMM|nr:hypothetical protein [Shewanella electrodiphila]MCL1046906.1 hypothetical protein [Shewanella electrodiphila]